MITVVGSLKGGSGKSTVTFNLAVWLTMADLDVRVLDLDPQATLRDVAEVRAEEGYKPVVSVRGKKGLDPKKFQKADEVLIDVGTAGIEEMKQAIQLADRVLVPVPPSQADIWSTQRFIQFVESLGVSDDLQILGFINRGDTHHAVRETDEAAAALVSLPRIKFVKPRLSQRTIFRRSFSEGLAVFELNGRSKGTKEFNSLCAELYPQHVR
ncbi:MAG: AAA family ATPase [Gammaproteobacteria bacterium]|nr:AAA family ATPase [Gammaproteobacteria bacterium]